MVNEARAIAHAARTVTNDDVCVVCGGRGHWSNTAGKKCLTMVIGNKIPREELEATQYPRGIKYPSLSRVGKYKKYDKSHDSKRVTQGRHKSPRRPIPKRPKSPKSPYRHGKPKSNGRKSQWGYKPSQATANEVQASSDSQSQSEESDDAGGETSRRVYQGTSLAIDYGSIMTPPPSPPAELINDESANGLGKEAASSFGQ